MERMTLAELKTFLVGQTITDVTLSDAPEYDAVLIHSLTLDNGATVSVESERGPVWVDYVTTPEGEMITPEPSEEDEDEEDEEDYVEPEPSPVLKEFLSEEQLEAFRAQFCGMNVDLFLDAEVVEHHPPGDETAPWPVNDMEAKFVTEWFEISYLEGRRRGIVGFGKVPWKEGIRILQGTHRSTFNGPGYLAGGDEWTRMPT